MQRSLHAWQNVQRGREPAFVCVLGKRGPPVGVFLLRRCDPSFGRHVDHARQGACAAPAALPLPKHGARAKTWRGPPLSSGPHTSPALPQCQLFAGSTSMGQRHLAAFSQAPPARFAGPCAALQPCGCTRRSVLVVCGSAVWRVSAVRVVGGCCSQVSMPGMLRAELCLAVPGRVLPVAGRCAPASYAPFVHPCLGSASWQAARVRSCFSVTGACCCFPSRVLWVGECPAWPACL